MNWIVLGALLAAASVAAGAFGAHALAARLAPHELGLWETAARYLMYGALSLVLAGLFARQEAGRGAAALGVLNGAGWCLLLGSLIFSGTVFALALGSPRILGAITPIGGVLLILGFLLFAFAAFRS
jgi:uncharacterized membrane protein YgdD (TMEM256/DUF423 family)